MWHLTVWDENGAVVQEVSKVDYLDILHEMLCISMPNKWRGWTWELTIQ